MNAPTIAGGTIAGQGIMAGRYIGQRSLRKEDPRLLTGRRSEERRVGKECW